uniref:ATP synthase F0 subunit 8 n=1 Tax=Acronicta major TaxID=1078809 RepID=UPI001FAFF25C|nr:ATP synthase F0 subunit 8 [Acronicta major]UNP54524.1 ATP synthase F0 subunit 8 [Acronicta major]UNP54934.1 ATP synthase F0 subunit 8 [Acronicta major]
MPQMMPINWMISFLFFLCIYLIFNIMNYYIFEKKNHMKKNYYMIKSKNFIWKW